MKKITFSTGEVYEFEGEVSVYDAAAALGIISREVLTAKVNGNLTELSTKISDDAEVTLYTYKDKEGRDLLVFHARPYPGFDPDPLSDPNRHCHVWPVEYDENDPEQQLFLSQITKYNLQSIG